MIDDKKIEHAAQEYNPINDMLGEEARTSFKHGVEWFKSALWHDASEEPEKMKRIITEFYTGDEVSYESDIHSRDWEFYSAVNGILRWCYIADLLPEGGSE